MSGITRKVEWMKLRELRADEQEMVRKRFNLHGPRMNTQKVQVVYTDQRLDGHHADDCEFPSIEAERGVHTRDADKPALMAWAGKDLREDVSFFEDEDNLVWVPAPCTCGVVEAEPEWSNADGVHTRLEDPDTDRGTVYRYVRPYMGLYATRGTPRRTGKKQVPQLVRFVPRPLTLAQALEYDEVDDVGAMRVESDYRLARGERIGELMALALAKYGKEAA